MDGNAVGLTATHIIPIENSNTIEIIRAENVQLTDHVIMFNKITQKKKFQKILNKVFILLLL